MASHHEPSPTPNGRVGEGNGGKDSNASRANVYLVPGEQVVSIEHPCILRSLDKGFLSLGGEAQIKHVCIGSEYTPHRPLTADQVLEHHVGDSNIGKKTILPEPSVGASLRPHDPLAKKIPSVGVETRNVLVRVTVPKRTGRKRKRGSDGAFEEPTKVDQSNASTTAPELLRRLQDNPIAYSIEPVAMLYETHRFRTLPDFQLRNTGMPIMEELRDHVMQPDYERLKHFNLDLSPNATNITAFPGPPSFTSMDIPYKYDYQQAAGVVFVTDQHGKTTAKNLSMPAKRLIWGLEPDAPNVPTGPPVNVRKPHLSSDALPRAIQLLKQLMEDRPIVTKRAAINNLPRMTETHFKEAAQHVGYSFRSGPWRDSLIRYGVDPRTDPKYRFYQTLMFQLDGEAFKAMNSTISARWARSLRFAPENQESHIFDGKTATANGKTWQICDITEPLLHSVFQTNEIRTKCDPYQWGWYFNGTMAKGRVMMRDTIKSLFAGETPPFHLYHTVLTFPNKVTPTTQLEPWQRNHFGSFGDRIMQISNSLRQTCKAGAVSKAAKSRRADQNMQSGTAGLWADDDDLFVAEDVAEDADLAQTGDAEASDADADDEEPGDFDGDAQSDDEEEADEAVAGASGGEDEDEPDDQRDEGGEDKTLDDEGVEGAERSRGTSTG